jgi:methionine aminopeptidase
MEEQYACLARIVRERDPLAIGVDVSETCAFGDGLTHSEHEQLAAALGEKYKSRVRSADKVCIGWLERRIQPEITVYPGIADMGHVIIAEAFSSRVIQPGITTTDDVAWWMRQTMLDLGLQAWFHPTIDIQAHGLCYEKPGEGHQAQAERRQIILPGDLLHCDMGFYYLGLATDHQQNAYVLKLGEGDAPKGLEATLSDGNRLQDILAEAMVTGRTGNEILKAALDQARREGLAPSIYTHPIGYHGHGAGPTIGLWDQQEGVPGQGDYALYDDTCYAIELNVVKNVPEWDGQEVKLALEEDAAFTRGRLQWLAGRQTELHLIG